MDGLEEYIKAERKRGFSIDSIKENLIGTGYDIGQVDDAIADLKWNLLHHMKFLFFTVLILAAGTVVILNIDTIKEIEFKSSATFGEDAIEFSELDWDFSTSNEFHFLESGHAETIIRPISSTLQIGIFATGTQCESPSMQVLTYEGTAHPYNPTSERVEVIKGNVIRVQLSEEEREDAVASVGWPVLTVYIDGMYKARKGIINPNPVNYDFSIDVSAQVGKDTRLTLAFENPCGIFDPETGELTVRQVNILTGMIEFVE